MPLSGGNPKNITVRNRGYDAGPVYTRDGKFILYKSQATPGFEADRWRLMAYNRTTGTSVELTQGFDQQVDEVVISPDGKFDLLHRRRTRQESVFRIPVDWRRAAESAAERFRRQFADYA